MAKKTRKHNLPETIYKNHNRWWWKAKLPGEDKAKARPLKPAGSTRATSDYNVAVECAKILPSKHDLTMAKHKPKGHPIEIRVKLKEQTVWLDLNQMAELFVSLLLKTCR